MPHGHGPDTGKKLMDTALPKLLAGRSLSDSEAFAIFGALFEDCLHDHQARSLLLLLAAKGESSDELWGAVRALRKLEKPTGPRIRGLMDTCGTGGDKSHSINVSTLAAFVAAGAGARIAKHGNRAISSRSGSSDLMESLGVNIGAPPARMFEALRKAGLGYFHAPDYHPVFAKLQPLRRRIGRRTILNLLGPLVNPMRLDHQLVGVSEKRLLPLYAAVLAKLDRRSALVCHSADGMDELSTAHATRAIGIRQGRIRSIIIHAKGFGLQRATRRDLCVPDPSRSHRIAKNILAGRERGPKRDAVILNAACALWISGHARSLRQGVRLARESLESGRALNVLKKLRKITERA